MIADLTVIEETDFDDILLMDWLAEYYVVVDCYHKTVTFNIPGMKLTIFRGVRPKYKPQLINIGKNMKAILSGEEVYLIKIMIHVSEK